MTSTGETVLSSKEITEILNAWGDRGWHRPNNAGDLIEVDTIESKPIHVINVKTQYESRSSADITEPYSGGQVDTHGTVPRIWDVAVNRPENFEKRQVVCKVPHTDRVYECSNCGGRRRVRCNSCRGAGTLTCSNCRGRQQVTCYGCQGRGIQEQTALNEDQPASSRQCILCMGTGLVQCTACLGRGIRNCGPCRGSGSLDCSACKAAGRLISYKQLTVNFDFDAKEQILTEMNVPKRFIKKVTGNTLLSKRETTITSLPELADRPVADECLTMCEAMRREEGRIIFQEIDVTKIPATMVEYFYGEKRKRATLWIYGNESRIHLKGGEIFLFKKAIILGLVTIALLSIIAAVWFALAQNISDPPETSPVPPETSTEVQ